MWNLTREQKVFDIGGVKIGGFPGTRPTVLIGTIFYRKHKIVKDERKGEFNHASAEELINKQEELSDKTGNPCMLDVVGASSEAMIKALDFVAGISNVPMLMDGLSTQIRIDALKYIGESGLSDRVVYNSISPETRPNELEALKQSEVENVVLLAYYVRDFTSRGRLSSILDLVPKVKQSGVEKMIIDTCVLDIPSLGSASKAIMEVKNELGYPAGCGAHNAIGTWKGLKTKMGVQARNPSIAVANALPVAVGGDFVLYGPIEDADYVFPTIALVDVAHAQISIEQGKRPSKNHPIYKIA